MLKDHALQFYLESINGYYMSFDEMCRSISQRLEPEEQTIAPSREWDTSSLPLVLQQNPGKSQKDFLNVKVSRLSDIQTALPNE